MIDNSVALDHMSFFNDLEINTMQGLNPQPLNHSSYLDHYTEYFCIQQFADECMQFEK